MLQTAGKTIGLIHPGAMGSVIGAQLVVDPERRVLWAGEGRSPESAGRADSAGLDDVGTLAALCEQADTVLSVCPPESAVDVAAEVSGTGFDGLYIDANAVSPETSRLISRYFERYVDGGIVGPPPVREGITRLYLSGGEATTVARWFATSNVEARVVGGGAGAASAVKMCFASWTKGTSALLLAIRALAEKEGVTGALLGEWETSMPDLVTRSEGVAAATGPKAWRFEGEMREISATFDAAGLTPRFHQGAAEVYHRLASLKGSDAPSLDEALALLLEDGP